jgi:GR25 family glycosyltransferase involved in LPS biosynthesis
VIESFVIKIKDQQNEEVDNLRKSIKDTESDIVLNVFDAVVPNTIEESMDKFEYFNKHDFKWTWPTNKSQDGLDMKTGIYKFCYSAVNQEKKVACSLSHMLLWDKCVQLDRPIIIFESDALVTRTFDHDEVRNSKLCGLNDPRGATRRSQLFHDLVSQKVGTQKAPTVNHVGENPVPQGIAGHSAYYITPIGAKELLDKVKIYGMWPNDAYVCKELFPWIRVVYPYFTKVQQGFESTTTR